MDIADQSPHFMTMMSMLLLLLLTAQQNLVLASIPPADNDDEVDDLLPVPMMEERRLDFGAVALAAMNHFRLWSGLGALDEDLGFWVKPRSTTWFSHFLLEEYDDMRWVQLFRMTKTSVFTLARLLSPHIERRDTHYRVAVPVVVRVACVLFKLCHGASLLICSEMFAIGRSMVSIVLREVVHAVNDILKQEMMWPTRDSLPAIASAFQEKCGMPSVAGAIDGTHFGIKKPKSCSADYFYYKSGAYAMHCQAVVDSDKHFLDIYVGMPGSTNDARVLRRLTLFLRGQAGTLWDADLSFDNFSPYLLGDAGYPLLPWLMVPHRRSENMSVAESLFNRRLSKGRAVVENTFAMLKSTFRELHTKSDLSVVFLPDVVNACALLHNVLMQQSHADVDKLLEVLHREALYGQVLENEDRAVGAGAQADGEVGARSVEKRTQLGWFLSQQRRAPQMDEP